MAGAMAGALAIRGPLSHAGDVGSVRAAPSSAGSTGSVDGVDAPPDHEELPGSAPMTSASCGMVPSHAT